ncbi:low temperature requirement protein A [Sphaerothrix gracilis]|uniref:low temperature requirement protein A n=1 Tax=Sphaerothrix gracilis TaxID=3151835 RepID=UPI0031FBCE6E
MSQPPHPLRLYLEADREPTRHATWLELFFDLVFVFAIAELAHLLHSDLSWAGIASFAALFVPVWWLWIDFSYYADQFDVDRGPYRLVMLGVMFGIVVMALTVPNALSGGSAQFAAIYATLRLVIIFLYVQAWRFVPPSRELTARYTVSFSIAFFLWLLSIAVPEPIRFWLWAIALLIEISNGPITYLTIRSVPTQKSHMDERFGLFVIIVLGEAIIAVATGVSQTDWQWPSVLAGLAGFLAAVSLWWMYFERADESTINWALRSGRRALLRSYIYGYSHLLIFMGIVATGVGIQFAIEAAAGHSFPIVARSVFCGGVALFLTGVTAVQWAAPHSLPKPVIAARLGLALFALSLISWAGLSAWGLVLLLSLLLIALNRFDGISLPA